MRRFLAGAALSALLIAGPALAQNGGPTGGGASISTPVSVPNGGTGLSTLTSGSVVVGNGSSSPSLVAPGTSGNVLTSNGATWTSSAAAGGGSAFPNYTTGAYYAFPFTTVTGGNTLSTTTIYASVLYFPNAWKASALAAYISTLGTSNLELAVYATAQSGGVYLPTGANLCNTGTISDTAAGPVSNTCPTGSLAAGFYAVETMANDTTMVCNALNGIGNSQGWYAGSSTLSNLLSATQQTSQTLSISGQTFGTWPNETSLTWAHSAGNRNCAIAFEGG